MHRQNLYADEIGRFTGGIFHAPSKDVYNHYRTEWRYGNASKDLAYKFLTARHAVYFFVKTYMSDYDYMYSVKRTIAEAQTALEIGAPQQAKFFLDMASEVVKLHTEPKYTEVLHGLFQFFQEDTFTEILQKANNVQNEVMRISNNLMLRSGKEDPTDISDVSETHEFFTIFNMLMSELKPLAMDAEREWEDRRRIYYENARKGEAIEAKKKEEKAD